MFSLGDSDAAPSFDARPLIAQVLSQASGKGRGTVKSGSLHVGQNTGSAVRNSSCLSPHWQAIDIVMTKPRQQPSAKLPPGLAHKLFRFGGETPTISKKNLAQAAP
jgi:hypothetical protein